MNRAFAVIIVGLVVSTWAIYFLAKGVPLSPDYFGPFSIAVGVLTTAWVIFKHWIWHWPLLHALTRTPSLTGTWAGKLRSTYIHPGEDTPRESMDVILVVTQSVDTVNVRQYTAESSSFSVAASITEEAGERFFLASVYINEPDLQLQQTRSPMHYGATRLGCEGSPRAPRRLTGNYWTARNTSGSLELEFVTRSRAHSFSEGMQLRFARRSWLPRLCS
jgi:hypothetical protein